MPTKGRAKCNERGEEGDGVDEVTTVLVTGCVGCVGCVGSHLTDRLLADGHEVVGVDSFEDYYPRALKEANLSLIHI